MKHKILLLIAAMFFMAVNQAFAVSVTKTYVFTSGKWDAVDENSSVVNWENGYDEDCLFYLNQGVQVTTSKTGANATSPRVFNGISQIVFTYNTNKSSGTGSITVNVGDVSKKEAVKYSGNGDGTNADYTATFQYDTPQDGTVHFSVDVSTNSIYIKSVSITYEGSSVATPVISPGNGTYFVAQDVTISCETDGGGVYYTVDGTEPTEKSSLYSSPIRVKETTTIKAVAIKDGVESEVAVATLIINDVIEDGVFDFSIGYDYGSGMKKTTLSEIDPKERTWTAGSVKMVTDGRVLWTEGGKLTLYNKNANDDAGALELYVSNGVITQIDMETDDYGKLIVNSDDKNDNFSGGVWVGSSQKVTVKHDGISGGVAISKITVTYVPTSVNVTIGSAKYITYCSKYALDFSGVNAYVVSEVSEDAVALTKVAAAPANTPVILNAAAGEYALNVSESVEKLGVENYLKVSDGNVSGGDDVYALALKDGVVGFNVVNKGVTIPKGKCYLKTNGLAKSRLEFDFGLANAVERVEASGMKDDGVYYNLNGQRVVNPSNGIYILNNRKVLIK